MSIVRYFIRCICIYLLLSSTSLTLAQQSTPPLLPDEQENIDVFQRAAPLVVNVHNLQRVMTPTFDIYEVPAGSGSGLIWDQQGHIVTNFHVIDNAQNVTISTADGRTMTAQVIGVEPRKDLAVLKLTAAKDITYLQHIQPLALADSAQLKVGQKAIAIGNPYGLDQSITVGIVSALNRRIPGFGGISIRDMIQTDASINPGNSGGPLLNSHGQLIGINTLIFSNSGSSSGIGFAIPANTIKRIVNQIINYGRVIEPGLGIQLLGDDVAQRLGINGVIIGEVINGTPAAQAQLQGTYRDQWGRIHLGDVIIAIDDKTISNYDDLYNYVGNTQVGDAVKLTLLRQGKTIHVTLKSIDLSQWQ